MNPPPAACIVTPPMKIAVMPGDGVGKEVVPEGLKVLREAGLVEIEPRAQQRFYKLRGEPLKRLREWIEGYRRIWEERFEELDRIVEELKQKEQSDAGGQQSQRRRSHAPVDGC